MNPTNENQPQPDKFVYTFSPVYVKDVIGTLFLGILSVVLLILYVRSNKRYKEMMEKMMEKRMGTNFFLERQNQ